MRNRTSAGFFAAPNGPHCLASATVAHLSHEPCGSFASFALVWPAAFAYTAEAMHTPAEVRRGILSHEDGAAVAVQVQKFARAASLLQSMPIEQIGTVPPACRFLYEWGVQCVLLQRICDQLDL